MRKPNILRMRKSVGKSIPDEVSFELDPLKIGNEALLNHKIAEFKKSLAIKYGPGADYTAMALENPYTGHTKVTLRYLPISTPGR